MPPPPPTPTLLFYCSYFLHVFVVTETGGPVIFCATRLQDVLNNLLPPLNMVKSGKKKKKRNPHSSVWWSTSSVSVIRVASAVRSGFKKNKTKKRKERNGTCPISISKCTILCVRPVRCDAFHVRMSKTADGRVLKKSFMNKTTVL